MSTERPSWRRRRTRQVEAEPEAVATEMEQATQRLRDQAWKLNATTRTPLIPDSAVRSRFSAASER